MRVLPCQPVMFQQERRRAAAGLCMQHGVIA
jgi:hypothetical protein